MSKKKEQPGAPGKKPVKHLYTHLSEYAIRDAEDRMSYINVIQNILLDEIPGALVSLFIGVAFTGGEGETFSVSVDDSKKKEFFRYPDQTVPPSGDDPVKRKLRRINQSLYVLRPAVFFSEGTYNVVLRVGGKVIHKEPFNVALALKKDGGKRNAGN
jgi:hypothetical protein